MNTNLAPVAFTSVKIEDRFWTTRQETNRTATVWHCFEKLEETGALANFRLAAQGSKEGFRGFVFADSDVYKVLEGASSILAADPDPALDKRVDEVIALLQAAQHPDGYLNTYVTVKAPNEKFKNLRDQHELYCAGHLIEAGVAHFQATGKRSLLDIATRWADLICEQFAVEGYGGHPELELALIKLWKLTKEDRYFEQAKQQLYQRGSHYFAREHSTPEAEYDGTYWQDDVPLTQHREIKGHAVRAAYLMSAATDLFAENSDPALKEMLDRVWENTVTKRSYVTGGIGTSRDNEGFTKDYDLPNESAYQETCASIALALWGSRMALVHAKASYFDAVEIALYNSVLSGVSMDGKEFFYDNPLASNGCHRRKPWFDCACCPPNVLRTIATLGEGAYAVSENSLYVNLFLPGTAEIVMCGEPIRVEVRGDYPWSSHLSFSLRLKRSLRFQLRIRLPGWCSHAILTGRDAMPQTDGYIELEREWQDGDTVDLDLSMPIRNLAAHPSVSADTGRLAVQRGPLIYCVERTDLKCDPSELHIGRANLKPVWREQLGGYMALEGFCEREGATAWEGKLYQPPPHREEVGIRLIPYALWANRGLANMAVWLAI